MNTTHTRKTFVTGAIATVAAPALLFLGAGTAQAMQDANDVAPGSTSGILDPGSRVGISDPGIKVGVDNPDIRSPQISDPDIKVGIVDPGLKVGISDPQVRPALQDFNPQPAPLGNTTRFDDPMPTPACLPALFQPIPPELLPPQLVEALPPPCIR